MLNKLGKFKKLFYAKMEDVFNISYTDNIYNHISGISKKIITTNYDQLLEQNTKIRNVITWDSDYNLSKLDDAEEFIFKIHGDISRPDSCILFDEDYKKIYSADGLGKFQFSKLLSQNSCLFIGFSFSDSYVKTFFSNIISLYGDFKKNHYIITVKGADVPGLQNIFINTYSELDSYLENLCKKVNFSHEPQDNKNIVSSNDNFKTFSASDSPPHIKYWVGRSAELSYISTKFKVIFITGIGGQGKSALASYYYGIISHDEDEYIVDWRDFKEEECNFQEKLISMIIKCSEGAYAEVDLIGKSTELLIDIFFSSLGGKKALFVLDNIDKYIDLDRFSPTGDMQLFFNKALESKHKSLFLFTCRPFIHFAGTHFYQIRLEGLHIEDVNNLFTQYKLNFSKTRWPEFANRIQAITSGHPLWINIIFAQAIRGENILDDFLKQLETNHTPLVSESDILSSQLINEVWKTLKPNQKLVLRILSEAISPLNVDQIADALSRKTNFKNVNKAISALNNLNLIETKAGSAYELHPIVKAFIKSSYPKSDQAEFISILIDYYGKFVLLLKEKKQKIYSYEEARNYSEMIELCINKGEYERAMSNILESIDSFVISGHIEDIVRVSIKLLSIMVSDGKHAKLKIYNDFFRQSMRMIIEFGRDYDAKQFLESFKELDSSKSINYILYLSLETYRLWFAGDIDLALKRGAEVDFLIEKSHLDDTSSALHHYSLALRDSDNLLNINKALEYFSRNENLATIADNHSLIEDKSGDFYGNIGRCLSKRGDVEGALNCYAKSYYVISGSHDVTTNINLGYASFWIYEELQSELDKTKFYFKRRAFTLWKKFSPPLANAKFSSTLHKKNIDQETIDSLEEWQIEKFCSDWVIQRLNLQS